MAAQDGMIGMNGIKMPAIGPLRGLLDARIAKLEACSMCEGSGEIPSLDVTPIEPTEPCPQCKQNVPDQATASGKRR